MEKFAMLPGKERREVFSATAAKMGVTDAFIEKDFWVCFVLKTIFESKELKDFFLFKGGTSLSKAYNLINRFSEDIDLILDWRVLGITDDEAWAQRSATQKDKFNDHIDALGASYISATIKPVLEKLLAENTNDQMHLSIDEDEGHVIAVHYPLSFKHSYLLDYVKMEIGPRASRIPYEEAVIVPYVEKEYPTIIADPNVRVKTIKSERTFWEKATILHQIAFFPDNKLPAPRSSRHYYDIFRMANSPLKTTAITELKLLQDVAEFKSRFYRSPAARYDLARPGTLKLLPSPLKLKSLHGDYNQIREMIFGTIPEFSEIRDCINSLEKEINGIEQGS